MLTSNESYGQKSVGRTDKQDGWKVTAGAVSVTLGSEGSLYAMNFTDVMVTFLGMYLAPPNHSHSSSYTVLDSHTFYTMKMVT